MAEEPPSQSKRGSSQFKGHRRRGRQHLPPMLDLPVVPTMRPFHKLAFPDFLWLLTMLRMRPLSEGAGPTTQALAAGQSAFHRAFEGGAFDADREPVFHGLLTEWEQVPEDQRETVLDELRTLGIYDDVAPESLAHALAQYQNAPGAWLFEPRYAAGLTPDRAKAEEHLWETMRLGGDSHHELATHAIYLWLGMMAKMRRLSFNGHDPAFKLVARYESDLSESERKVAETTLRASFLAASSPEVGGSAATEPWCEQFWRTNRMLFHCITETSLDPDPHDPDRARDGAIAIYRLHYRFLKAADAIDPNLWDHDRYDVLTGVTWRILRIAAHLISHPSQWSEEHGYPSVRMLFEGYVQLKWMLAVEETRAGVWREFKNYGRGRTKALMLHTEDVIGRSEGRPREILEELLPKLKAQANRDVPEAFQDISTASTFAGDTSLFEMARLVGLDDMYQSVVNPASSTLHGDWGALEDQVLERCLHPLHDRHAVPKTAYAEENMEQFPYLAESFATWTMDEYCRAMGHKPITDDEATAEMLAQAQEAQPSPKGGGAVAQDATDD
jgi:Family of unknown function (DUF5677)